MYVRTSSEARAETTWMHAQATPPQTMLLACMLSAEAVSLEYKGDSKNTVSKETIRNTRYQSGKVNTILIQSEKLISTSHFE